MQVTDGHDFDLITHSGSKSSEDKSLGHRKTVRSIEQTKETLILSVKADKKIAVCPWCSKTSHRLHQNKGHLVRDLPIGNRAVIFKLNRR